MSSDATVAREVVVHGRVQGVFFRATCSDEAERVGARGWVRNDPGGTVTAHFEGSPDQVEAMVAWCRHGPRLAVVTKVDVTEAAPTDETGFLVR